MQFDIVFSMSELSESGFLTEYPDAFAEGMPEYGSPKWKELEAKYGKQLRPERLMKLWKKLDIPVLGYECESADEFDENVRFHMIPREDTVNVDYLIPKGLNVKMY